MQHDQFFPLLTNNIAAFWRCRCRSRCRFLNSLLRPDGQSCKFLLLLSTPHRSYHLPTWLQVAFISSLLKFPDSSPLDGFSKALNPLDISGVILQTCKFRQPLEIVHQTMASIFPYPRAKNPINVLVFPPHMPLVGPRVDPTAHGEADHSCIKLYYQLLSLLREKSNGNWVCNRKKKKSPSFVFQGRD